MHQIIHPVNGQLSLPLTCAAGIDSFSCWMYFKVCNPNLPMTDTSTTVQLILLLHYAQSLPGIEVAVKGSSIDLSHLCSWYWTSCPARRNRTLQPELVHDSIFYGDLVSPCLCQILHDVLTDYHFLPPLELLFFNQDHLGLKNQIICC